MVNTKKVLFYFSITSNGNSDHHSVTHNDDSSRQFVKSVAPREKSFQRRQSTKQNGHRCDARNVLGHESGEILSVINLSAQIFCPELNVKKTRLKL